MRPQKKHWHFTLHKRQRGAAIFAFNWFLIDSMKWFHSHISYFVFPNIFRSSSFSSLDSHSSFQNDQVFGLEFPIRFAFTFQDV